jgi:hypothetical protein
MRLRPREPRAAASNLRGTATDPQMLVFLPVAHLSTIVYKVRHSALACKGTIRTKAQSDIGRCAPQCDTHSKYCLLFLR